MFSYFQAVILGLVQGITELFPISSLGHSVILPTLLHWNIHQKDQFFLTFLVATHTATAIVLFLFFWSDWVNIIDGLFRSITKREINEKDVYAKLAWALVIGTIPAGIGGLLLEDMLKNLFASPQLVAIVLILNGILLFVAEWLRRKPRAQGRQSDANIAKLGWQQTIQIGLLQALALIPGFSRTGATLTGGLLNGLSHEDAARFSFLLATPIIGAASLLKLPELITTDTRVMLGPILAGAITAGIAAYFSVKFLMKYFETKTVTPFAVYCIAAGSIVTIIFLL